MTNLGPLPTTFEESIECDRNLNDFYWVTITTNGFGYFIQGPVEQTSCLPSGYNGDRSQYYSPAQCPIGFTTACSTTELSDAIITCCPTCGPTTARFTWQSTLGCVMNLSTSEVLFVTVVTDGGGATYKTTTTLDGAAGFNAYAVQVRYQSTDFASTATLSTLSMPSTIATSTTPVTTPNMHYNNNDGLSPGTAAGVTAGAFTGAVIIIAIVWYLVRRSAQRQRQVRHDQPVRYQPNYDAYPTKMSTKPPHDHGLASSEGPQELG